MKILLIDELIEIQNLEAIIRHHFPTCHILPSSSKWYEGLMDAKNEKPDILLVNLDLLGLDGMDLLEVLHIHNPFMRMIVYTAQENFAYAKKALDIGVLRFLLKPFPEMLIINVLNSIWNEEQKKVYDQHQSLLYESDRIRLHRVAGQNVISSLLLGNPDMESLNIWLESTEISRVDYGCIFITLREENIIFERLLSQIQKSLQELQHYAAGIVKEYERTICMLIFPEGQLTENNYRDWVEGFVQRIEQKLSELSLTFFVSSWAPSYEYAADLWNECQYLMNKNDSIKGENVLFFETTSLQKNNSLLYARLRKEVQLAVKNHDWEEVESNLRRWIRLMKETQLQINEINMLLNCLLRECLSGNDRRVSYQSLYMLAHQDSYTEPEQLIQLGLKLLRGQDMFDSQDHQFDIVLKALDFIWEYYAEDISLDNVAKYAEVSSFYLSRLLKKHLNYSFVQILTFVRIQESTRLLSERQDLTIRQISEQVGFTSESYFYKVYKKYTGITAGRLRQLLVF